MKGEVTLHQKTPGASVFMSACFEKYKEQILELGTVYGITIHERAEISEQGEKCAKVGPDFNPYNVRFFLSDARTDLPICEEGIFSDRPWQSGQVDDEARRGLGEFGFHALGFKGVARRGSPVQRGQTGGIWTLQSYRSLWVLKFILK